MIHRWVKSKSKLSTFARVCFFSYTQWKHSSSARRGCVMLSAACKLIYAGHCFDTSQTSWWHYPTCVFNYWQSVEAWNSVQASFHGGQWQSSSTGWLYAANIWALMWFVRNVFFCGKNRFEISFLWTGRRISAKKCLFLSKKVISLNVLHRINTYWGMQVFTINTFSVMQDSVPQSLKYQWETH